MFAEGDPYTGIDFDECRNLDTGALDPWVAEWLQRLGGYQEYSPSGSGVHAVVEARLPGGGKNTCLEGHKVEVYDRGRFFTVTSEVLREGEPEDAQETVTDLYGRLEKPPEVDQEIKRLQSTPLADEQLLEKARTARNGWKFKRLYDDADWERLNYPSQSEADLGLIDLLIFWTGGDRDQIVELFEASALYRNAAEGKRDGYVPPDVDRALASYRGPYYSPKHKSDGVREELRPYFDAVDDATAWKARKDDRRRPTARKALLAVLLVASEHGKRTNKGVVFDLDMRTFSEVAHVSKKSLRANALPLLIEEGYIQRVREGSGTQAGSYLLPLELCEGNPLLIHTRSGGNPRTAAAIGDVERRELLRASEGRSSVGLLTRVGNAGQMMLEILMDASGNRASVEDLADRTERRRPDVRRTLQRLSGLNLAVEIEIDVYMLPADFWRRWDYVLEESGVKHSEQEKKRQHDDDRLVRAILRMAGDGLHPEQIAHDLDVPIERVREVLRPYEDRSQKYAPDEEEWRVLLDEASKENPYPSGSTEEKPYEIQ